MAIGWTGVREIFGHCSFQFLGNKGKLPLFTHPGARGSISAFKPS